MFKTLDLIAKKFNDENITWAIGASLLLNHYGLVENPNDIDILVDLKDIKKVDDILKEMGKKKPDNPLNIYSTRYFYEYEIEDIDIDVMAGFTINHDCGSYEYIFYPDAINLFKNKENIVLPFTALEDWYILYQLIPGREKKVDIIESYFMEKGVDKPQLLERALNNTLPHEVITRTEILLKTEEQKREELNKVLELRRQQLFKESNELIVKLAKKYPQDSFVNYQCAWSFDVLGLESRAVPYYEKAIAGGLRDEDLQGALLGLGSTYRTLGEYKKSRDTFERALKLFPENRAFNVFYAMTLYNLGEAAQGMEILLKDLVETTEDENIKRYRNSITFYSDKLDTIWK